MSLAWSSVKALSIPVGGVARDVKRVSAAGVVLWEKPNPLPYDAEVEYVETVYPNAAWVDTGVYLQLGDSMLIRYMATNIPSTANNGGVFGSEAGAGLGVKEKSWQLVINRSVKDFRYRLLTYSLFSTGFTVETGVWNDIEMRSAETPNIVINGGKHTDSPSPPPGDYVCVGTARVFGVVNASGVVQNVGWGRVASLQIKRGSSLIRDFTPVRVGSGSSAVGYLYDRANPTGGPLGNGLYGSGTAVPLVAGPDKS